MPDQELQDAIDKAVGEINEKSAEPTPDETPTVEIPESDDEPGQDEPSGDELSDDEINESKALYKLLKDPQTSSAVIAALAQKAGIFGTQNNPTVPETKTEIKEAKKSIKELLHETLDKKQLGFLADDLGETIEKVLQQERESQESRFQELQQSNLEREVESVSNKLNRETKGDYKTYETRMSELAKEIPIGDQSVEVYMRRIYAIASSEKRTSPQKIADQIRRNSADAPSRLRGTSNPPTQSDLPKGKMSINQAVNYAIDQLQRKGK